jgi:hypothetical protein
MQCNETADCSATKQGMSVPSPSPVGSELAEVIQHHVDELRSIL